jgi:HK97 family phage portal protein
VSVLARILGGGRDVESKATFDQLLLESAYISSLSKAGVEVSPLSALRVSAMAGCVRAIAQDLAQLPVKLMQEVSGETLPAKGHVLSRIVRERPNAWQTSMAFRGQLTAHAALGRGGYALVTRVGSEVRELLPAPYNSVRMTQGVDWSVRYFARAPGGTEFEVPADSLLRIESLSWTGLGAIPAMDQARDALGLAIGTEESQANLHKSGGRPAGLLSTEQSFGGKPEMANRVRENWLKAYGAGGTGGIAVVDAGMKFQQLTMTGVDAQHLETRKYQVEEVCRFMGVPPTRIGYSDKASTYASAAEFAAQYVKYTIRAWAQNWEESLSRVLLTDEEIAAGYFFRHEMGGLLEGTPDVQANIFKAALGTASSPGWMSVNDVRRKMDMNPLDQPGADLVVTPKEFAGAPPPGRPPGAPADEPADDVSPVDAPPVE